MVPYLMERCRLEQDEADKLFMLLVYGLFYVNRSLKWSKDDAWYQMQLTINRFMFGGFTALEKNDNQFCDTLLAKPEKKL